jgi:predicted membrane GTPase involved in stress response
MYEPFKGERSRQTPAPSSQQTAMAVTYGLNARRERGALFMTRPAGLRRMIVGVFPRKSMTHRHVLQKKAAHQHAGLRQRRPPLRLIPPKLMTSTVPRIHGRDELLESPQEPSPPKRILDHGYASPR